MPLLSVRDAGRRVADRWLWRGLTFEVASGERVAVAGPSGSGKSLLLRALIGLDDLDEGTISLDDRPLADWHLPDLRMRVRYVPQTPAFADGSVREALAAARAFAAASGAAPEAWAVARLERLGRDARFLDASTETLSGGEAQIAALLRAMQSGPQLFLLDEPTASLDPDATEAVERLVSDWLEEDATRSVVWTSHSREQRDRVTTRVIDLGASGVMPSSPEASGAQHATPEVAGVHHSARG